MLESMDTELLIRPSQERFQILRNLPGYFTFVRFAAFRDIELQYFDQVDGIEHIGARYQTLNYGCNVYLQSGEYLLSLGHSYRSIDSHD